MKQMKKVKKENRSTKAKSFESMTKKELLAELSSCKKKISRTEQKYRKKEKEIEEVNQQVMTLLKHKRDFIDKVAFGIRSFLTPIEIPINLIAKSKLSSDNQKRMYIVRRNIEYLNKLVHNVLDVAKLEGNIVFGSEKVSVPNLISSSLTKYKEECAKKKITVVTEVDSSVPNIWVDEDKIINALERVIGNAVTFIGKGTKKITISADKQNDMVAIHVADTGIGIDSDHLAHIFDNFYKTEGAGSNNLGLGLSIAKQIVEAHRGTVKAASAGLGKGTTITITLPIKNDLAAQNKELSM